MNFRRPLLSTAVAMVFGLVILYYFFFPSAGSVNIRAVFLGWATALAAVALLIGIINLLVVHLKKVNAGDENVVFSAVLGSSLIITFLIVLIWGPNHPWSSWIFDYVQTPIESSLMATLSITLVYAAARLLRRRPTVFSLVFLGTLLLVLLGISPLASSDLPWISDLVRDLRAWLAQVPAAAGARGILIGVSLGVIATGLRVLVGSDRPYGG